jgi:hypothetical protein
MRLGTKKTVVWSTIAAGGTVLSGIFLSPAIGVLTGLLLSTIGLVLEVKTESSQRLTAVETQLVTIQTTLAREPPFPFDLKYLQLQERNCPLFKHATLLAYKKATADLDALAQYELFINDLEGVFYWLEQLFCEISIIKSIKAISCGEFDEWQQSDNWWMHNYLRLHKTAIDRGAEIERIFIVKSHDDAATVDRVLKSNVKNRISVRVGLQGSIQRHDMQCSNCILFFNDQHEALYALVAQHNYQGDFENAVIYGDPEKVKGVLASYLRIKSISEPYHSRKLLPEKTS